MTTSSVFFPGLDRKPGGINKFCTHLVVVDTLGLYEPVKPTYKLVPTWFENIPPDLDRVIRPLLLFQAAK